MSRFCQVYIFGELNLSSKENINLLKSLGVEPESTVELLSEVNNKDQAIIIRELKTFMDIKYS